MVLTCNLCDKTFPTHRRLAIHQKACNSDVESSDDETLIAINGNNVIEKEQADDEHTDPIETSSIVNSSDITHEYSSQTLNIPVFVSYHLYPNNNCYNKTGVQFVEMINHI